MLIIYIHYIQLTKILGYSQGSIMLFHISFLHIQKYRKIYFTLNCDFIWRNRILTSVYTTEFIIIKCSIIFREVIIIMLKIK